MVHVFESCGWEYNVLRTLRHVRDRGPVLLAARKQYFGSKTMVVELRPMPRLTLDSARFVKARLSEELQLGRYLHHPHIGAVLGFAVDGDQPYLVCEHVPGCSLETVVNAAALVRRKVSIGFAVTAAVAVAEALEHVHRCVNDQGQPLHIVHRAVSPANIQISQRGQLQLVNFGSAYSELDGRCQTPPWILRGDVAYMAPEALRPFVRPGNRRAPVKPHLDKRADIFSLGMVLLGTLTGWHPLDPPDALEKEGPSRLLPQVSAETTPAIPLGLLASRLLRFGPKEVEQATKKLPELLRPIIAKALQVDPSERYQSAVTMADDLRGFLRHAHPKYRERDVAAEMAMLIRAAKRLGEHVAYSAAGSGGLPASGDQPGTDT